MAQQAIWVTNKRAKKESDKKSISKCCPNAVCIHFRFLLSRQKNASDGPRLDATINNYKIPGRYLQLCSRCARWLLYGVRFRQLESRRPGVLMASQGGKSRCGDFLFARDINCQERFTAWVKAQFVAGRRGKRVLNYPRDKEEGPYRSGDGGEEPVLVTPGLSYVQGRRRRTKEYYDIRWDEQRKRKRKGHGSLFSPVSSSSCSTLAIARAYHRIITLLNPRTTPSESPNPSLY